MPKPQHKSTAPDDTSNVNDESTADAPAHGDDTPKTEGGSIDASGENTSRIDYPNSHAKENSRKGRRKTHGANTDRPNPKRKLFQGVKGRSGPARNNRNAMRHGLSAGKLPEGCAYVEDRINVFRRKIEDCVVQAKAEISLTDASIINTAVKWERHGMLASHWLRTQYDELSAADRLKYSEQIAKASDSRDRAIGRLKLDEVKQGILDTLYARPQLLDAPQNVTNGEKK